MAEQRQQIRHGELFLLLAGNIDDNVPGVHHNEAVAVGNGVLHVVRDHERREVVLLHDAVGQLQNLRRRARVERSRMLVEQQQLRLLQRRHQQRQRLPLTAGEQTDLCRHTVLKTEIQGTQTLLIIGTLCFRHAPAQPAALAAPRRQREIFFDLHGGCGAHHGVLEHAP